MKAKVAILPGIVIIVVFLNFFTGLISSPRVAWASTSTLEHSSKSFSQPLTLSKKFPQTIQIWKSLIEQIAAKYNIEPDLIAAVILQESAGDENAYSTSGAVGLMQVMPCDGLAKGFLCDGSPCFQQRPITQELLKPEFNVDYGVRMLIGLNEKFNNWREVLRSYGPYDVGYGYADSVLNIINLYR
jgi:hypothetical protein